MILKLIVVRLRSYLVLLIFLEGLGIVVLGEFVGRLRRGLDEGCGKVFG